jgi:hypothetical protein
MNTVIIINLNGNAFHLEEPGYHSLRDYLERAQAQLRDNPDRAEIMAISNRPSQTNASISCARTRMC